VETASVPDLFLPSPVIAAWYVLQTQVSFAVLVVVSPSTHRMGLQRPHHRLPLPLLHQLPQDFLPVGRHKDVGLMEPMDAS
jgi:hypothetical protein